MAIKSILIGWLDALTGRKTLKTRNDKLVAQNNRLGKEILALRKALRKPRPHKVSKPSADKIYMYHIQSQRQHLLVKALAEKLDRAEFLEACDKVNKMTDQEVIACGS